MDLDDEELLATRKLLGLDKTKIEKSIENLKEYLEKDSLYVLHKKGENKELSDFDKFCIGHCEDIEVLITEYERQKQRNKEHQKINGKLREKAKVLIKEKQELTSALLDSIPKQKIKDEIEELENIKTELPVQHMKCAQIAVLQKLLQESEDK